MTKTNFLFALFLVMTHASFARSGKAEVDFTGYSLPEALHEASYTGKGVFIFFETPGCRQCKWMTDRQFTKKEVGYLYNQQFVSIHLSLKKTEVQQIAMDYGINQHHALLFLNAKGSLLGVTYGPLDDHQIVDYGKKMAQENLWYNTFKTRLSTKSYTLAELQKFLLLDKDYPDAQEVLDEKILKAPDKEFYTLQTLETVGKFYSDVRLSSFDKLLKAEAEFKVNAEKEYYDCVHSVYTKYFAESYIDTGYWKSNIDSVKYPIEKDALTDYLFAVYTDSLRSFIDKSFGIKWKKAERDTFVVDYSEVGVYWVRNRAPKADQLKAEIIHQCDAEFYGYERLKNLTREMIKAMYKADDLKYWAYHTDAYFYQTLGDITKARGLMTKAIQQIKQNDPYNIQLLRYFQHQLQEMK